MDQLITLYEMAITAMERDADAFKAGIFSGALLLIFLLILVNLTFMLVKWSFFHEKCTGIQLKGDNGTLLVSTKALEDFIRHALAIYEQMKTDKISLIQQGSAYNINIKAELTSDANMVDLKSKVETTVLNCIKERIGSDNINQVDIQIDKFSAKPNTGKQRKLAQEFYPELTDTTDSDTEKAQ